MSELSSEGIISQEMHQSKTIIRVFALIPLLLLCALTTQANDVAFQRERNGGCSVCDRQLDVNVL